MILCEMLKLIEFKFRFTVLATLVISHFVRFECGKNLNLTGNKGLPLSNIVFSLECKSVYSIVPLCMSRFKNAK